MLYQHMQRILSMFGFASSGLHTYSHYLRELCIDQEKQIRYHHEDKEGAMDIMQGIPVTVES